MADTNRVPYEPDSLESGFFIDMITEGFFYPLDSRDLPTGVKIRYLKKPRIDSCPSLLILPWREEFRVYLDGWIPLICYGSAPGPLASEQGHAFCSWLNTPLDRYELAEEIGRWFNPLRITVPGGYLELSDSQLISNWGKVGLTAREERLLSLFFLRENRFLESCEIRRNLAVKNEKPLLSRLRVKINRCLPPSIGIRMKIAPVRDVGYFLWITVDKLWITG